MTVPVQILGYVLCICITLAVGMGLGLFAPSVRIVEIDSEKLLRAFVDDFADQPTEDIETHSKQFIETMQAVLDGYALRYGVIVVESRLAVAGSPDISAEAYQLTMSRMNLKSGGLK